MPNDHKIPFIDINIMISATSYNFHTYTPQLFFAFNLHCHLCSLTQPTAGPENKHKLGDMEATSPSCLCSWSCLPGSANCIGMPLMYNYCVRLAGSSAARGSSHRVTLASRDTAGRCRHRQRGHWTITF